MKDKIISFVNELKLKKEIHSYDEQATKQGIILKILLILGWDVFDINEVYPEYVLKSQRVDYSLRINKKNKVFIEAKRISTELENHQEQLLKYSFRAGVSLAILTNGLSWWFYLPLMKEAWWEEKKFYTVDLLQQEPERIAAKFVELLSKDNITSGQAIKNAEATHEDQQKRNIIKKTLPKAWNKIISEPQDAVVNLLMDTTETLCGHTVGSALAKDFLVKNRNSLTLSEQVISKPGRPPTKAPFEPTHKGRAARLLLYLQKIRPRLRPENVGLLIEIDKKHSNVFRIDWHHTGKELMVFSKEGIHRKPANAIKETFGEKVAAKYSNIARKMGTFVDISKSPPELIARFGDFEGYIARERQYGAAASIKPVKQYKKNAKDFFSQRTSGAREKIRKNILNRRSLWNFFLQNGQMHKSLFKEHSEFKPKAISGFMQFLTRNGLATRDGDIFILNQAVIPQIKKILG
jgi:predicted type IV restriction endonuclease